MTESNITKEKSGEEVAKIYKEKFASTKNVHNDKITAELIEKIRDNFDLGDIVTTKLKNRKTREIFDEIGKTQRQRLDNGDFSINELSSITKQHGIILRDSFLKNLGTNIWTKITGQKNIDTKTE